MAMIDWIRSLFQRKIRVNVNRLPSQGFFYKPDFGISIKRADEKDVLDYEMNYDGEKVSEVLRKLKYIVKKNTILDNGYDFSHIKSIDIVYLFLEIVRITKGKPVVINYFDDEKSEIKQVEFGSESFNYFVPDEDLLNSWNGEHRYFDINGYRVSLPSIGIENSLTHYLIEKSYEPGADKYNDYSYDFTFLLDDKSVLKYEEIDNLIQIFNFDIDDDEKTRVENAVNKIKPMQKYSIRVKGKIIDLSSKINLEKIWK